MARLTRTESQARTRADLIATARDLFVADGYAATSLERVAEEAGYSKGAVYSNFTSKKELCLEALTLLRADKTGDLAAAMDGADSIDEGLRRFQGWAERTLGDFGWTILEFEFFALARHDPALREQQIAALRAVRQLAAAMLATMAEELSLELPVPAEDAASGLLSLGIGLGIQRAVDPSIPAQLLTDALRMLFGQAKPKQT
jgi:AcrR family transcriptional regulator